ELADPDRRLAAGLNDLVCEPLEQLAITRIEWQRRETIQHLHRAEPAQLPPQRTPRRRRVARQPVGEQHPGCPARRHPPIMTESATAVAQLAADFGPYAFALSYEKTAAARGRSVDAAPRFCRLIRRRKKLTSRNFLKPSRGLEPRTPSLPLRNGCRGLPPVADRPV